MKHIYLLIVINFVVLGLFGAAAVQQQNTEFIYYLLIVCTLAAFIVYTHKHYPKPLLWGLSGWGWAHMAGGTLWVGEQILYDVLLIRVLDAPFYVLRYDQVVHVIGTFLVTLVAYYLVKKHVSAPPLALAVIVGLIGLGLATINEIIELGAVLVIEQTHVGDYFNIAFDLFANTIGAVLASSFVYQRQRR